MTDNALQVLQPGGQLQFTFNWTDDVPDGVTPTGVDYEVPFGLTEISSSSDLANKLSTIEVGGGAHGETYQVKALLTLSNSEIVPQTLTVRCFNG